MSHTDPVPREPDQLRDQLRRLFRHRAAIVLGLLLGVLAGGALSAAGGTEYTATGEVVVQPVGAGLPESGGIPADRQLSMATERQVAGSAAVAARAARALGGRTDPAGLRRGLRVSNPPETHLLEFAYTADSPRTAVRRADAFVRAYLDHREETAERRVESILTGLSEELEPLLARRAELDRRIADADGAVARESARAERETLGARIADLQGRVSALRSLDTSPGDVVREGEVPEAPSGPGAAALIAVGAVVGLAGGLVAAWLRSLLDPRVRSAAEARDALGAPVLGTLPRRRGSTGTLEVGPVRGGERAETYRAIAFRVLRHPRLARPGSLLVVSAREHAEAVSTAVNLAAALAETGSGVLLVEADPRAPEVAGRVPVRGGAGERPGADWPGGTRLTVDADTAGTLELVPGRAVPDATRALNSPELARLLTGPEDGDGTGNDGTGNDGTGNGTAGSSTGGRYTVALTRPLLSHADGLAVAGAVRGVLVVCVPDRTRREDLERVRELVASVGGHVVGAVLHPGGGARPVGGRTGRWPVRLAERLPLRLPGRARRGPGSAAADPSPRSAPGEPGEHPTVPADAGSGVPGPDGPRARTGDDTALRA
ncbi:lipopolysaccharide biosynthesis protein [Streptomyces carminius]|uniref:Lipopolysaccharide biosynthesis protein n=1 Tax=Streptomyces carminius TaxID=2665496 RepID=A0A2M8MC29_9ACTN|nr:lipopolysaccharide biosynthesis protein [Streptomyces carminius]PJE97913.1 lipopolysaccharide biosynthesis protein [Streptomyces carminius]PJF01740.1 lipopolysaccharide biosynthesis protein [Streptomyces carminius]